MRALRHLDVPGFRFHDLRHYAASTMHAIGVPDQYIMQRGGWSSGKTLKAYEEKYTDMTLSHYEGINTKCNTQKKNPRFSRVIESDRRGSNPRSRPWQGRALPTTPLSHFISDDYPHRTFISYMISGILSTLFIRFWINPWYSWRAGDGNRTHVSSLEGWCSTIELHPHSAQNRNRTSDTRIFSPLLYRLSYLGA